MNRRGFLGSILVAFTAPAIVRADSLMRIIPSETLLYPTSFVGREFIREAIAYDIAPNKILVRLDILGKTDGKISQLSVDMQYDPSSFNKNDPDRNEVALSSLLREVQHSNFRPVKGLKLLADGYQSRFI